MEIDIRYVIHFSTKDVQTAMAIAKHTLIFYHSAQINEDQENDVYVYNVYSGGLDYNPEGERHKIFFRTFLEDIKSKLEYEHDIPNAEYMVEVIPVFY